MDSFELNKIGGALTGSLMAFLLVAWFSDVLFHPGGHGHGEHQNYYAAADAGHGGDHGDEKEEAVDMVALIAAADPAEGAKVFKKCASCHKAEKGGAHGQGPALYGVMGRKIAAADGFKFSDAFAGKDVWNWETMNGFLTKPKDWAPGTRMKFAGLKKPEQRAAVMVYLNGQSDAPIAPPTPSAAPAAQ